MGRHNSKRASFGHSVIIDPWGTVVAACPDTEGIALGEIDTERYCITIQVTPSKKGYLNNVTVIMILKKAFKTIVRYRVS